MIVVRRISSSSSGASFQNSGCMLSSPGAFLGFSSLSMHLRVGRLMSPRSVCLADLGTALFVSIFSLKGGLVYCVVSVIVSVILLHVLHMVTVSLVFSSSEVVSGQRLVGLLC